MVKKHHFNLIEITLALLVISIGVMSIMGLIPIGAKAHSDAVHKNHAADAAEEILNYASLRLLQTWSATPTTKPDVTGFSLSMTGWSALSTVESGSFWYQPGTADVYRMVRKHTAKRSGKSVEVHEFDAVFAVWKSSVTGPHKDGTGYHTNTLLSNAVRVNVEVSWPGALAYERREKMYFSMEVYKP